MTNSVGPEIAGALARFWVGGSGPSVSTISSALALAGYDEPETDANKQQRVLNAIRNADEETAKRIVEELLNVLRPGGMFDTSRVGTDPRVESLRIAFERRGFKLAEGGYADWVSQAQQQSPSAKPTPEPTVEIEVVTIPSIGLLVSSLRRLAFALRPLVQRRRGRAGLTIKDEYDLQDLVESLLKSLYSDVRAEERTPSYARCLKRDGFLAEGRSCCRRSQGNGSRPVAKAHQE
jgi:hypothetical protein